MSGVTARFLLGDTRKVLRSLPAGSVDLVLTSPPFLALRSYLPPDHPDKALEIGSEPTPAAFLDTLLDVVEECARVLAPHGSLCWELGDTFAGSGGAGGDYAENGLREGQAKFNGSGRRNRSADVAAGILAPTKRPGPNGRDRMPGWPQDKSLCLIPGLFAASLAYGRNLLRPERETEPWRVRNLVAWVRPNPPVGALGDKVRPATSYLTWACKARDRWFDLDAVRTKHEHKPHTDNRGGHRRDGIQENPAGAPPLDWWCIPPTGYAGSHYACVDDQTEALTPTGWKRHGELHDGDLIAAYDRGSDQWTWQPASFHRYRFDGDLVTIRKRTVNQALTPNHRVLYRTTKQPVPQVRRADTLTSGCFLPMAARMRDEGTDGPGEKLAALAGWVLTEGSIHHRQVTIYQSVTANPLKVARIEALLNGVGARYTRRVRRGCAEFTVCDDLAVWLAQFHKRLPWEAVATWPDADAEALFDAIIDGDGHRRPNGRCSLIQKDRGIVDAFQALATRLGYRTSIGVHAVNGCFVVYCSPGRWVDTRSGEAGLTSAVSRTEYHGTVWCPHVTTGFWLARRGDIPFVTGNTYPPELCVVPIEASCPRRVCLTCGQPSRRTVEKERPNGKDDHQRRKNANGERQHEGRMDRAPEIGWEITTTTTGWTTCGCPGTDGLRLDGFHDGPGWRPGVVLDPFCGSGTTLAVALGHGRSSIGIDLDSRNAELAAGRLGMFLTVEEPFAPPLVVDQPTGAVL